MAAVGSDNREIVSICMFLNFIANLSVFDTRFYCIKEKQYVNSIITHLLCLNWPPGSLAGERLDPRVTDRDKTGPQGH